MRNFNLTILVFASSLPLLSGIATAQLIHTESPRLNAGSSYYERNGFQWNANGPGFFFRSGQPAQVPFGNAGANAGTSGGFAFGGGGISGNLRFNFAQGSSRSISSSAPSLTTMNGYPGSFSSQVVRPFVTGITPVLGDYPTTTPTQRATEAHRQMQASRLQQQRMKTASKNQQKAYERYRRGVLAEEEGDLRKARANYRAAQRTAQGALRTEVNKRMRANGW